MARRYVTVYNKAAARNARVMAAQLEKVKKTKEDKMMFDTRMQDFKQKTGNRAPFSSHVTAEEFVAAWTTSKDMQEVADRLKMTVGAVSQRARQYMKRGVNLPRLNPRPRHVVARLDVDGLNLLVDHLRAKKDEEK